MSARVFTLACAMEQNAGHLKCQGDQKEYNREVKNSVERKKIGFALSSSPHCSFQRNIR